MKEVKKFDVISLAKIQALITALVGLIEGFFFSIISLLGVSVDASPLGILGVFSIILFPIIFGVFGFVFGLILGWFYNLVAGKIGGVKIELR